MSGADSATVDGRDGSQYPAVESLAAISDEQLPMGAYGEAMKRAYWDDRNVPEARAIAEAGADRLLAFADQADDEAAYDARSAAKALMYDLASFTWPGWDEPGVVVTDADTAAGRSAAAANLALAVDLDKGDLPVSRGHWMLGAHLLTAGAPEEAREQFDQAARYAVRSGADAEADLAVAFAALSDLSASKAGAEQSLTAALETLGDDEDGATFVEQVETVRRVLGV